MASIDRRVVEMKFDNAAFERGVATTMGSLSKLGNGLSNLGRNAKGLGDFNIKTTGLDAMHAGVASLTTKFSGLQVAGLAALATIASKATIVGTNLVKSLTLGPINEGFSDYNAKLTSVQTIVSATGKSVQEVDTYFRQLDEYADKTVFNLSDMTGALAKFTNAGVDLNLSVPAIKGIANMTALAGQGADSASIAFYNLSQSIAGGFLTTTDYKSLNLANVATKEWKDQMIAGAVAAGTLTDKGKGIYAVKGGKKAYTEAALFTEALSEGWASAEILTTVLGDYGDATTAIGKKAQAAAQNVKSFPMMMETLRAAVGTQWTDTFELLLGNVEESTVLFTGLTEALTKVIGASGDARNKMLTDFKALGGREATISALSNVFTGLGAVLKPIGLAFRELFPRTTGAQLADIAKRFQAFSQTLIPSGDTVQRIKSTFEGLFSILKLGVDIAFGFSKAILNVFGTFSSGGPGVLAITAVIGEFIRKIYDVIKTTDLIDKFFAVMTSPLLLIQPIIGLISDLAIAVNRLLMGDVSGFTDGIKNAFSNLISNFTNVFAKISGIGNAFSDSLDRIAGYFRALASGARESGNGILASLFTAISKLISLYTDFGRTTRSITSAFYSQIREAMAGGASFVEAFRDTINNLIGGLIDKIQSVSSTGKNFMADFGTSGLTRIQGLIASITETFQRFRSEMGFKKEFDGVSTGANVAAGSLSILSGIGALIATVFKGLGSAFSGIAGALGPFLTELSAFFTTLITKFREWIANMDMNDAVSVLNTGFFIALYIVMRRFISNISGLAGQFGDMADNIGKTFGALTSTLTSMQRGVQAKIILQIAIAVAILVGALYVLTKIDPGKLAIALKGLGVLFAELAATLVIVNKLALNPVGMISAGAQMVLMAVAIKILASAVTDMAALDYEEMKRGLLAVGALLATMALFTKFVSLGATGVAAGTGLVLLAIGVKLLTQSVQVLGAMDTKSLIKGIGALIIMVTLLAGMVLIMNATKGVPAAAAGLIILAGALLFLLVPLKAYASMDWATMGKGLLLIAVTMVTLGLALRTFPTNTLSIAAGLLILSVALTAILGVVLGFGSMDWGTMIKGMIGMGAALAILVIALNAASGSVTGAAAIAVAAAALYILLPAIAALGQLDMKTIAKGVAGLALVLGVITLAMYAMAPVIVILSAFSTAILVLAGAVVLAASGVLIFATGMGLLAASGGAGIAVLLAGFTSFMNLLPLWAEQFGHFLTTASIVMKRVGPKVLEALGTVFLALLAQIRRAAVPLAQTMGTVIMALVDEIARRIPQIAAKGLDMILGILNAIKSRIGEITDTAIDIVEIFITTITDRLPDIIKTGLEFVLSFIEGLAAAIRGNRERVGESGADLATAIVEGMVSGLGSLGGQLAEAARTIFDGMVTAVKDLLGIQSPSKVFTDIGIQTILGMIEGIGGALGGLLSRIGTAMGSAISTARTAIGTAISVGVEFVTKIITGIGNAVGGLLSRAGTAITSAISAARTALGTVLSVGTEFVTKIISGIVTAASGLLTRAGTTITSAITAARTALGTAVSVGTDFISKIISGIATAVGGLLTRAGSAITSAISAARSALGTAASVGGSMISNIIGGISGAVGGLLTRAGSAISSAISAARTALGTAASVGSDMIGRIISGISSVAGNIGSRMASAIGSAIGAAKGAIGDVASIGRDIVSGIVRGISGGFSLVTEAARNLASSALKAAKGLLGINSPSKEFEKIGEFVNEGFVKGLTGGTSQGVTDAITKMADLLKDTITAASSEVEKSTEKLKDLTKAQQENTDQRKLDQAALDADIAKLKEMTAERAKDEAARIQAAKEIARDKEAIKALTAERNRDLAAVKAAQTALDQDKAQLAQLTSARVQDKNAIVAKRAEIAKDTITLREAIAERNKDTTALKAHQSELAKDESRYRSLLASRNDEIAAIAAKNLEIDRAKERLGDLTIKEQENAAAIVATKDAIAQATSERDRATRASEILSTQMQAEVSQLQSLATQHEALSKQLDDANKSLTDAIKARDDYQKSVEGKYSDLPDINKDSTLEAYLATLQKKVDDTNNFSAAVQKLRDMGLNDATYRELVEKGVDALPFVNALLEGGQSSVDSINKIGSSLLDASKKMADQASAALYNAGVQTGQGLVNGLNSQLAAVQAAMATLAAAMTAKIEAELKIKSPSRVFQEIGKHTGQGLVNGLKDSKGIVGEAAGDLGSEAMRVMQKSLKNLDAAFAGQVSLDPVIRPILDLSDIKKGAKTMGTLMAVSPVSVGSAYSSAVSASAGYRNNKAAALEKEEGSVITAPAPTKSITFVQHNTSPKALSPAELYRQTNNQLSRAKGALNT